MRILVVLLTLTIATAVNAGFEVPAFNTSNFSLMSPVTILDNETGKEYSLMGLKNPSQDAEALHEFNASLSDEEMFCTVYTTGTWCNLEPSGQILAQLIIDKGLAFEDCEASQGQFGTCKVDQ